MFTTGTRHVAVGTPENVGYVAGTRVHPLALFGLAIPLFDFVMDVLFTYEMFQLGHMWHAYFSLGFIALPACINLGAIVHILTTEFKHNPVQLCWLDFMATKRPVFYSCILRKNYFCPKITKSIAAYCAIFSAS